MNFAPTLSSLAPGPGRSGSRGWCSVQKEGQGLDDLPAAGLSLHVPSLALGVTGLRGPPRVGPLCLGPQAPLPPRSHFPPPLLSPERACTSDVEVGPSTPTGSKQQTLLTIAGSGCPSSGQESWPLAGGEAACLSPCTAAVADLGRGVWRGHGHAPLPVCAAPFHSDHWSRMASVPPSIGIPAEGGCGRGVRGRRC